MVQTQAAPRPREKKREALTFRDRVDTALREALSMHEGSTARWDKLTTDGATDNDIWRALHGEFGPTGGASQTEEGIQFTYLGSKTASAPPQFWVDATLLSSSQQAATKPTLAGAQLVKRVRELLAIPLPKGNGHDGGTVTQADIAEAEQLLGGEQLVGMPLFGRVRVRLLELKNLTDFENLVNEYDLSDLIDTGKDKRLAKYDAAKLRRMLEATCNELPPAAASPQKAKAGEQPSTTAVEEGVADRIPAEDLPRMQPRRFTQELPVEITPGRRTQLLEEMRQLAKQRQHEQGKLDQAKADFKREDKRLELKAQTIDRNIDRGTEYVEVECEERFDYVNKVAVKVRLDTEAELERRPMTTKELQPTLLRL